MLEYYQSTHLSMTVSSPTHLTKILLGYKCLAEMVGVGGGWVWWRGSWGRGSCTNGYDYDVVVDRFVVMIQ